MLSRVRVPRDQHLLARVQVLGGERDGLPALAVHGERAGHQVDLVVLQHLEPLAGGDDAELQPVSASPKIAADTACSMSMSKPSICPDSGLREPISRVSAETPTTQRAAVPDAPATEAPPGPGASGIVRLVGVVAHRRGRGGGRCRGSRRRCCCGAPASAAGAPAQPASRATAARRRAGRLRAVVVRSPVLLHSLRDAAPGQDRRQQAGDQHQPADAAPTEPPAPDRRVVRLRGAGLEAARRRGRERRRTRRSARPARR